MAARRAVVIGLAAALLGGCAAAPTSAVRYSHLTYDRTYTLVLAALADQKLTLSTQDRRSGVVVGKVGDVSVTATMTPQVDTSIRVDFTQQPAGTDPALLKRVTDAYANRMAQLGVLGVFKDSDGGSGPVPCPSGPAFCP